MKALVESTNMEINSPVGYIKKGKRGGMTVSTNVAIVLARSIQLCIDGQLDQIGINI